MVFIFWLFVLTLGVVKCSYISENYIIEKPDIDVPKAFDTSFKVYWNVPTKQCRSKKIPFDDLLKKYSITYNKNDRFEGEHITILYDSGYIPRILKSDGAKYTLKNGGLPQEGNLELHLIAFRESVNRLIPDPEFNGVGVIDMENWRPIFRQHWSGLTPVIDLSLSIEKRHYWWWPSKWQKMEATKRFEDAARLFMEKTLTTAKQMRPKAIWGYYGYPYCYNMMSNNMVEHCSKNVKDENDRTYWLWAESTGLYPSIYISSILSTFEIKKLISGRLTEANRVKLDGTLVIPYFALTYDGKASSFLSEEEIDAVFETLQKKQASSLIVWGSSNDVNTVEKCNQLYKYIDSSFGPIAKKYIQKITKTQAELNSEYEMYGSENNLNDNIDAPTVTTVMPKTFLNKNADNIVNYMPYTTKNYELGGNETVNKSPYKNISSSDNISSENNSLVATNDNKNTFHPINLPVTEKSTNEKMFQNSPTYNSWNEFIISSENVSNHVNLSVDISVTEFNADYAHTKDQEQQLKKYFYETDVSDSDFKNNSSDIWSVISYDTSFEQEKSPGGVKNGVNPENLIEELVEIDNNSIKIIINDTKSFINNDKTENTSTKINDTYDFNDESTLTNNQNNITYYSLIQAELFDASNPPTQMKDSEISLKRTNSNYDKENQDSTSLSQLENSSNIETVPRERNNTFLEKTNYLLNTSAHNTENVKTEESLFTLTPQSNKQDDIENTTNSNIEGKLNTEDKDSDYLITLAEEPLKNVSAFENIESDSNTQPLLPSEYFIKNFDYLITLDDTKSMNSTLNENYTNTTENFKQENKSQYTLIPPSSQEDKLIKNILTPNGTDYDDDYQ